MIIALVCEDSDSGAIPRIQDSRRGRELTILPHMLWPRICEKQTLHNITAASAMGLSLTVLSESWSASAMGLLWHCSLFTSHYLIDEADVLTIKWTLNAPAVLSAYTNNNEVFVDIWGLLAVVNKTHVALRAHIEHLPLNHCVGMNTEYWFYQESMDFLVSRLFSNCLADYIHALLRSGWLLPLLVHVLSQPNTSGR